MAMSLALAFQELTTTVTKYGALSGVDGRVSIKWAFSDRAEAISEGDAQLAIEWRERDGLAVTPTDRKGFGTRMMERMFNSASGNSVSFSLDPLRILCRFEITIRGSPPVSSISPAA